MMPRSTAAARAANCARRASAGAAPSGADLKSADDGRDQRGTRAREVREAELRSGLRPKLNRSACGETETREYVAACAGKWRS